MMPEPEFRERLVYAQLKLATPICTPIPTNQVLNIRLLITETCRTSTRTSTSC